VFLRETKNEPISERIPRWWLEGGAENEPPIVKSWRDARDTLCRQNHQEEAKL
jgi:hypothetical protein